MLLKNNESSRFFQHCNAGPCFSQQRVSEEYLRLVVLVVECRNSMWHAAVLARGTQVDNVNLQGSARILTVSKVLCVFLIEVSFWERRLPSLVGIEVVVHSISDFQAS
jgi:hypothetical protein